MENPSLQIKVCLGTSGRASGGEDVLNLFRQFVFERGIEAQVGKKCERNERIAVSRR